MLIFDGDNPMAAIAMALRRDMTLPLEEVRRRDRNHEDIATASPAMVAALVLREGRMASPTILRRAETFATKPGPVGKLFDGLLGRMT